MPLSVHNFRIGPRRLRNLLNALMKDDAISEFAASKCTPLDPRQVKITPYRFTVLLFSLMVKGPKNQPTIFKWRSFY